MARALPANVRRCGRRASTLGGLMAAEAPRRRPRRGSLERPVSTRIYRAAWLVVAVPVLVAAFSVGRPDALTPPRTQPFFDKATALQFATDLATSFPDRSPGTDGQRDATDWVESQLREYGFSVERQTFSADIPGLGTEELVNVVATAPRDRAGEPPGPARHRHPCASGQPGRLSGRGRQRLGHGRAPRAGARPRQRVALAPDRPRLDRRRSLRRPRGRPLRPEPGLRRPDRRARQPRLDRLRQARRASSSRATRRASPARPSWPRPTSPSRSRRASSHSGRGPSRSSSTSRSRSASSSRLRSSRAACPR